MANDDQPFPRIARLPLEKVRCTERSTVQRAILEFVTDLSKNGQKKLDMLAKFFAKIFLADEKLFVDLFGPFMDFLRNNPQVDFMDLMLHAQNFKASIGANAITRLLATGTINALDLETILPKSSTNPKGITLLAILLKRAGTAGGILQDTFADSLVQIVFPEGSFMVDPTKPPSMDFMAKIMKNLQILGNLYRKKVPIEMLLERIGEKQGPQAVLFILLMLGQGILSEEEIGEILQKIDNEGFTEMFQAAKKNMESMLPPGVKQAFNARSAAGSTRPGSPIRGPAIPRLPGSGILQRISARLLSWLARLRKD
jgi:hypothetical protein